MSTIGVEMTEIRTPDSAQRADDASAAVKLKHVRAENPRWAGVVRDYMVLGCAHPMGPLRLADLIGLDTLAAIAESMYAELRDAQYVPPSMLLRMVDAGLLGRKSGHGFHPCPGSTHDSGSSTHFPEGSPHIPRMSRKKVLSA